MFETLAKHLQVKSKILRGKNLETDKVYSKIMKFSNRSAMAQEESYRKARDNQGRYRNFCTQKGQSTGCGQKGLRRMLQKQQG